jgi:membrane protease YdiL (CAAX protease family)
MSPATALQNETVQPAKLRRLPLFWRILSYLFLFILVNLLANLARVGLDALGLPPLLTRLAFTLVYIAGVLGLTYIYRRSVDRKAWSDIGLPALTAQILQLVGGLVFGVLLAGLIFGFEYIFRWIQIVGYTSDATAVTLLIDSLLLGAAFGVSEEICMRGYLFQNLGENRPVWQAILITGIIFGAFHLLSVGFGLRGATFFVFAFLLNIFLVLTRLVTGSLWTAIGFHTAFDWAAINLGLGSVVLADQHLLQVERGISLPVEDLLGAIVIGLGVLLLMNWACRNGKWNESMSENLTDK